MMNEDQQHTDQQLLITRYLAGEASTEEKRQLLDAIERDARLREEFHRHKRLYRAMMMSQATAQFDDEAAYNRFAQQTNAKPQTKAKIFTLRRIASIAAVILIVLGIGAGLRYLRTNQKSITSEGVMLCSALPDGSTLYLNRQSDVDYPETFASDERSVKLSGEAYFAVKHDSERPFTIVAGDIRITVLGTKFDVRNYNEKTISVVVNEGRVRVETINGDQQCELRVGERADYDRTAKTLTKSQNGDPNYLSWQTGLLVFNDVPFGTVVETLARHYEQKIKIENTALNNCRLTAKYQNYSLDKVLSILVLTFNITVEEHDSTYIINGKGCDF